MWTAIRHFYGVTNRRQPALALELDGRPTARRLFFAIVSNAAPWTYLGSRPLHLAPDATLDSPLTMVTIRTLKLRRLGRLAGSALFSGGSKLRRSRHVDYRPDVRAMTVSSDHPFPYQVDGDYLGHVRSLEFRYEPDALRLIVP